MSEQRMINIRIAHTSHTIERDGQPVEITDPIRIRPKGMSRREWRDLVRKGHRATKKAELQRRKEEAALPESVKLDRRMHAAGLLSPRDMGRIVPVEFNIVEA